MTYLYYEVDKLKSIYSDTRYQEWLDSYQKPNEKRWFNAIVEYFAQRDPTQKPGIAAKVEVLFNAFPNLAYKLFIIYIQEKDHPHTRNFHNTIAQSALVNFLEHVESCEAGSNERLNTIIANFFFSENDIKSIIHSFRAHLVERIAAAYFKKKNTPKSIEVHIKGAFERAANQYLQFNIYAPPGNEYNTPSEEIRNFLSDKLPLFNSPFKLLQYIEGQIQWMPKIATVQEKTDFESMLKVKLGIKEVDAEQLWMDDDETYESTINKEYIRQLICQKLCELEVFNKKIILNNGRYILPKPRFNFEHEFIYWYKHFATEKEKNELSSKEKKVSLFLAVKEGDLDMISQLIARGADVNFQDHKGRTALIYASWRRYANIVQFLIKNEANVNIQDNEGCTALIYAVQGGHTDIAQLLIDRDADVNIQDHEGCAALIHSVQEGRIDMVQQLIDSHADINLYDKDGETALMYAFLFGHARIAQKLIDRGANLNLYDTDGRTALIYAVLMVYQDIVQELIEKGADVNIQDKFGNTALLYAIRCGCKEMVQQLINSGADINIQNKDGDTALIYATRYRRTEMVQQLINSGANVNFQYNDGETVLMYAVRCDNTAIVRELIKGGADVNIKDKHGMTALVYATRRFNDTEIIALLIGHGADIPFALTNPFSDQPLMKQLFRNLQYFMDPDYQKTVRKFILDLTNEGSSNNEVKLKLLKDFHVYTVLKWDSMFTSPLMIPFMFLRVLSDAYLNILNGDPIFKMTFITETQKIISNMIDEIEENSSQQGLHRP